MHQTHDQHHAREHDHTMYSELICHIPYGVFSVAGALALLSIINFVATNVDNSGIDALFHSFHFMHIVFAATGTVLTFLRFSNNIPKAFVVGLISPTFFCITSDVILPYLCGRLLGVPMDLHLCFISELTNVLPFCSIVSRGILRMVRLYATF